MVAVIRAEAVSEYGRDWGIVGDVYLYCTVVHCTECLAMWTGGGASARTKLHAEAAYHRSNPVGVWARQLGRSRTVCIMNMTRAFNKVALAACALVGPQ